MERDTFDDLAWPSIAAALGLSARELDIAHCLVTDARESAIAEHLGIARDAVSDQLERLYRKVGVNNRLELIAKVFSIHLHVAARAVDERARGLTAETTERWPSVPTRGHDASKPAA
jgi:DNA-binding CsgD family transcriptional regulator